MKTTMIALATVAGLATSAAYAGDFDNTGVDFVFTSGNLSFAAESTDGELDALETRVNVLPHSLGFADADVTAYAGYSVITDEAYAGAKYNVVKDIEALKLYGSLGAEYDVGTTDWTVTPKVGADYVVAEKLSVFAEVSYDYNASQDWAKMGGEAALGVNYAITDAVAIRPSVVRTFDTGADETNLNVAVALAF